MAQPGLPRGRFSDKQRRVTLSSAIAAGTGSPVCVFARPAWRRSFNREDEFLYIVPGSGQPDTLLGGAALMARINSPIVFWDLACLTVPNQFQTSSKPVPNQFQTSSKPSFTMVFAHWRLQKRKVLILKLFSSSKLTSCA